jgi:hypothetical protein
LTRFAGLSSRPAGILPAICFFLSTIGAATVSAKHLILFHMTGSRTQSAAFVGSLVSSQQEYQVYQC